MKKLFLICLLSIFSIVNASAQFFQWAKKQDNAFINHQPQAPFILSPIGGNFLAAGNNLVAQTGLFNSPITFANQTFTSSDSLDAFLAVHDLTGNLLWAKQIRGITYKQPSVAVDNNNNIIITGMFLDSLRIDGLLLKSSPIPKYGVYTIKFNSTGSLLWARSSDISNNNFNASISESSISTDASGNIFIAGVFSGTLPFNGTNLVGAAGINNIYVVKYSANGTLQWAKAPAISGLGINITTDPSGNLIISTSSSLQTNMKHQVTKLDQNGSFTWNKVISTGLNFGINLTADNAGNTYVVGYLSDTDTIGNTILTFTNGGCFLAKLDAVGNWKWVRKIADNLNRGLTIFPPSLILAEPKISFSPTNHLAIAGVFSSSAQFIGYPVTLPQNSGGTFIMRADTAGNLDWVQTIQAIQANNFNEPTGIAVDSKGAFYGAGNLNGTAQFGNISLNTSAPKASYLTKITNEPNLVTGAVFIDTNNNNIYENTENPFPEIIIGNAQGVMNGISAKNGTYKIYTPTGNTTVTIANPPRHYLINPASHSVSFTGINQTQSGKDFALSPILNSNDAGVTITSISVSRPGSTFKYRLTFKNYGTTILSDTLKFTYNSTAITYVTASVVPLIQQGSKINWYYQNLQPNETRSIDVTFSVPTNSVLGTPLTATATIKPLAIDLFPADNYSIFNHTIVGSYDPNDKQVDKPIISPVAGTNGEFLEYTIRFQNTGTDTAFTVMINDKISSKLDLATFEMLSASHPYKLDLKDNNTLEWRFDNILLPDSGRNELESHGFVRFRIKSKPGLVLGDSISNNAAIYFDYNAPVLTNYAVTKVANPTGIKDPKADLHTFNLYPNPAKNYVIVAAEFKRNIPAKVMLVNMLGQIISEDTLPANNQIHYQMPLKHLPKGVYLVRLETENGLQAKRLVIQ